VEYAALSQIVKSLKEELGKLCVAPLEVKVMNAQDEYSKSLKGVFY
jgi:hypothetical protein